VKGGKKPQKEGGKQKKTRQGNFKNRSLRVNEEIQEYVRGRNLGMEGSLGNGKEGGNPFQR